MRRLKCRRLRPPEGCVPKWSPAARFPAVSFRRAALVRQNRRELVTARHRCLPSVLEGAKSPTINPTQKQFSLNRGAPKQFPISSNTSTLASLSSLPPPPANAKFLPAILRSASSMTLATLRASQSVWTHFSPIVPDSSAWATPPGASLNACIAGKNAHPSCSPQPAVHSGLAISGN